MLAFYVTNIRFLHTKTACVDHLSQEMWQMIWRCQQWSSASTFYMHLYTLEITAAWNIKLSTNICWFVCTMKCKSYIKISCVNRSCGLSPYLAFDVVLSAAGITYFIIWTHCLELSTTEGPRSLVLYFLWAFLSKIKYIMIRDF